ncbi:glycosyltransferase family 2 protein [Gordonibacter massiliensis (ex Traore et al. 2017)]|uniref:glycosyltransferase family 2 protein n=1 Tax=Gordonibacter massiliensis (ex Traore et al. 2017) TaxID=1841863 RepID=UPI001FE4F4C7|nr:glycosyltransferase family 2 protein [Gordonibacter massiliensis (ex Traore et al. 2017)]
MSTYNGESHLEQQLDSVLGQDVGNLSVYVRDDGSQDGTLALLESYERQGSIHLLRGENVGVVASFLAAIAAVPCDVEFIALCDQDDEWHVDKLSRALSVLGQKDNSVPQLYCSEYRFCDADMNPTGRSHLNRIGVSFPTMLYENMVSGNTMVMNRALANRVNEAGREGVYCHDWWIALVATALGELTFDDFVSLEYRRTGSNASPTGSGGLSLLRYRLRTFFEKGELTNVARQLERLYRLYADEMPSERRALLERALTGGRLSKAFVPVRLRQKPIEEAALRLLLVLGRL